MTFTGVLSGQEIPNEPVQVTVEKPDKTTETLSIPTDANGAYSLTKPYLPGTYKITALSGNQIIPTTGQVTAVNVAVYKDAAGIMNCTSIAWASLSPGKSVTYTV